MKRFLLKRMWVILLVPAGFLLTFLASKNPAAVEKAYSAGFYRFLSSAINRLTGLLPFSLAEICIYLGILVSLFWIIRGIVRLVRKEGKFMRIYKSAVNLMVLGSIIYFVFVINCGLNYYRYPFANHSGLTIAKSTAGELAGLCEELIQEANTLREELPKNKGGTLKDLSFKDIFDSLNDGYEKAAEKYAVLGGKYGAAKPVLASKAMSYTMITGIFVPFTFEANVNTDIPAFEIPHTMSHEMAHLRGFMREEDANYIGYLACMESNDKYVRYSGVMSALTYSLNALYGSSEEMYSLCISGISDGVKQDIKLSGRYWAKHAGKVSEAVSTVNDTYLKANNQDGEQNYGYMVDLLLAEYRKKQEQ